jgi:hypothetical protein
MQGYNFDFSYKINHVSFGKEEDLEIIQRKFSNLGVLNPLDNVETSSIINSDGKPQNIQTNFYLIAVPSYFKDTQGYNYNVYQLTANYQSERHAQQNLLLFSYELSPITVQFF